jgi:hypothetical protein
MEKESDMRPSRIAVFLFFVACSASAAWAQYGLYGSPDMLRLPQPAATQDPAVPQTYPNTASPSAQLPPAPAYQASAYQPVPAYQPAPSYQPRPSYPLTPGYPAAPTYQVAANGYQQQYYLQPTATAAYRPYQPPAQYPYPNPYAYPSTQMAAAGQPAAPPLAPPPTAQSPGGECDSMQPADAGMANQMLDEQGGCYGRGNGSGPYRGAVEDYERAAHGACADGSSIWQPSGCCQWYASVSALVMNRSDGRSFWTGYASKDLYNQGGNTNIPMAWQWGGEVDLGHRFCCNCVPYAVEATFWTTEALTGCRSTSYAGDVVNTLLDTDFITFHLAGGDQPANNWFYGAGEQTLMRRDEYYNLEVNLIREQLACTCDSPWDIGWSVGIRYFRFEDHLVYDSIMPGCVAGGVNDAYLADDISNNLVGVQIGFDAAYNFCNGLRLFIKPRVGIYNNFMDNNFQAQLGDGVTNGYSTAFNQYYPVHASRDAIAFLTQVDVGAEWQFNRNWGAKVGYRVLAATGIGMADDQFPQMICDMPQLASVANPSCLVLHGAFLGLTYCF